MSDPQSTEPDAELLEFLGDIDEVNDESREEDLTVALATTDIDKLEVEKLKRPAMEEKSE